MTADRQFDLKARLRDDGPGLACWLMLGSTAVTEIMARAGYDAVMIDMEHGPMGFSEATEMLRALNGFDVAPLARIPANDPVYLKRILDTGVTGVMVPAVQSAADARQAVASCRYPPDGHRGLAATVVRATGHGAFWQEYLAGVAERLTLICQIESPEGLTAVEEIAGVDGVDMLFVGPFDLSAQLGYLGQPDHPEVQKAVQRIERAAKAAGKLLGGIATPERGPERLIQAGYDLLIANSDVAHLRAGADASIAQFRDLKAKHAPG
ncbi:HpcH/HpaI aldolase family protein [Rhodovibrio sodomensis]|nr:aldolase/citrate lyase family protein [Rhodovibrio sodomensis]